MKKNILALQIPSLIGQEQKNFQNLEAYLKSVLFDFNLKPDFLFLPEVWTAGWYPEIFPACADEGRAVDFLCALAKKYSLNIFGGSFIRKTDNGLKNSMPVITKDGSILGFYDKIHLYTPDGEGVISHGKKPCIFDVDGLLTGVSICYDIRFPELFRSYAFSETPPQLLVNLSAWPYSRKEQYVYMASSRAIENQAYFLALSQCGEIKNGVFNAGNSCVFDPMGNLLFRLDENRGFIYFTLDTAEVDKVRNAYPNLKNAKVRDFGFDVQHCGKGSLKC